jgi:alcohol dehydrogenase
MQALVYHGPGQKAWEEVPDPEITDEGDVIVQVDATTICGTDLHILAGDVPGVLVSCISACGTCRFCREGRSGQCLGGGGWILGYMIDGTQAEYVRVPFAENSVYRVPEGMTDAEGILLSDILPTGFEIGVQYGHVAPGDVVAVIGSGPVGLSAVMTARLYGPSKVIAIDLDNSRLARAAEFGATNTVNSGDPDWKDQVLALTDGLGVDVAIEAVGVPETFTMATLIVRPGGNVANIGVHGKSVDLALNELWIQNIDISMGLVNTNTLGMLLKLVAEHKLPAEKFVTHEFSFDQLLEAYDVFEHAADHDALKVLIH